MVDKKARPTDVKEILDAAVDLMIYGRSLVCITADGMRRIPPEEWHALADDIVLPKRVP